MQRQKRQGLSKKERKRAPSAHDKEEEEEVEELCHDLFKDFTPTRENKSAEKSNEIPIGAMSTKHEALEKVASDEALGKVASDEALEKLVLYVISCGGKRDSLEGWSARRYRSGTWRFLSKEGIGFTSRPKVAHWLNLSGAPKVEQRTIENIASHEECKEKLEELASYVVLCGGKRDLLEGWSTRRDTSRKWRYSSKKGNIWFKCRPDVARWLELPGAPILDPRTNENIASPEECKEALEKLVSYIVLCGGTRDLLEGWSTRRAKKWRFLSKEGMIFQSRPDVARWLNLPCAPDGRTKESKKRKR
jgi:hypothetical protein